MTSRPDPTSSLDVLRHAPHVVIHTVGFAAARLPEMIAYTELRDRGAAARPEIDALLRTGSPSGRVYAALLLEALDAEEGRKAWASLANDPEVTSIHPGGCLPFFPTTVGAFASAVLESGGAAEALTTGDTPPWARPELESDPAREP
ncbi:hypothetical protein [Pendulispora albinea]|uniref:Uncharacterized protein n=1 Tax=Pendulispora albinea TaxID=2741071 RepID=A0ABZ2LTF1_9BACT